MRRTARPFPRPPSPRRTACWRFRRGAIAGSASAAGERPRARRFRPCRVFARPRRASDSPLPAVRKIFRCSNCFALPPASHSCCKRPMTLASSASAHSRSNALSGLGSFTAATWNCVSAVCQSSESGTSPPPRFNRCDRFHSLMRKCFSDASRNARNRPRSALKPSR